MYFKNQQQVQLAAGFLVLPGASLGPKQVIRLLQRLPTGNSHGWASKEA